MQAEKQQSPKKAPRPIPPAQAERAAKLKAQGFNVWAKADGSLGWGKPKNAAPASAPAGDERDDEDEDDDEDTGAGSTPRAPRTKPEPAGSVAATVAAVVLGVAGLALAGVAAWKAYKVRRESTSTSPNANAEAPTLH